MANNIKFDVDLNVRKESLNSLKQSLQDIAKMTTSEYMNLNKGLNAQQAQRELSQIQNTISQVEKAFKNAFNADLGSLNVSKFNQELKSLDINKIYTDMSKLGPAGASAFRSLAAETLTANNRLKQTHSLLDSMAETMGNTIKWGIASSMMNSFTGAVQQAYGYVKNLDTSLNDIQIVTGKSADEMARFAETANNAAQNLGTGTTDYTKAALIYYQQGLNDAEVQARTETTLKAANVTGQSAEAVSEQLTAVWNGYKVSAEETELYVDKLAAVAATTAADLEELSTGMSRVASAAANMGVDVDQLNAQLATIVSVTRQAPESVGTALRSIYARMSQLKVDGEDDFGVTLGNYTKQMKDMGIEVLDQEGNLREMGQVIEEVADKWGDWTNAQRNAAAQAMAGTRQYNNLIALFDNWDMYTEALETSQNALGTLQEQQDTYMESTAAHLQQMRTAFEGVADSMLDTGTINDFADIMTVVLNKLEQFIDTAGGGGSVLLGVFGTLGNIFSKQLSNGIITFINNIINARDSVAELKARIDTFKNSNAFQNDQGIQTLVANMEKLAGYYPTLTSEERTFADNLVNEASQAKSLALQWEQTTEQARQYAEAITATRDDQGNVISRKNLTAKDLNLDTQTDSYFEIIEALDLVQAQLDETATKVNEVKEAFRTMGTGPESLKDNFLDLKDVVQETQDMINKTELNTNATQRFNELVKELQINTNATGKDWEQALSTAGIQGDALRIKIQLLISYMEKVGSEGGEGAKILAERLRQTQDEFDGINRKAEEAQGRLNNFFKTANVKGMAQGFTRVTSSISQMIFTINSAKGLMDTLTDDTISTGEKINQTITQTAMALPSIITMISGMAKGLALLASVSQPLAVIVGLGTALVGVLTYISSNFKTAGEAAKNSVSEYAQAKSEVQNLTTELESCRSKLKELYDLADQRTLTIAEEDELAALQAQTAELESQLALKQAIAAQEGREAARDLKTAFNEGEYDDALENQYVDLKDQGFLFNQLENLGGDAFNALWDEELANLANKMNAETSKITPLTDVLLGNKEEFDKWANDVSQLMIDYEKQAEDLASQDNITDIVQSEIEGYQYAAEKLGQILDAGQALYDQQSSDRFADLESLYNTFQQGMSALIENNYNGINDAVIARGQEIIKAYLDMTGNFEIQANRIWASLLPDQETFDNLKKSLEDFGDFKDIPIEELGDRLTKVFDTIGLDGKDAFGQLELLANNLGISIADLLEHVTTNADLTFKEIEQAKDGGKEEPPGGGGSGGGSGTGGQTGTTETEEPVDINSLMHTIAKEFEDLELGDTIKKKAYETLDEDLQKYFMDMHDGTYMLIDSALNLKEAAEGAKTATLEQMRAELDRANRLASYDFDELSTKAGARTQGFAPSGKAIGAPLKGAEDFARASNFTQDTDKVKQQIALIQELGTATEEQMQKVSDFSSIIEQNGTLTESQLKDLALIVYEQKDAWEANTAGIEENTLELYNAQVAYGVALENVAALEDALHNGTISFEAFNTALAALRDQLDEDVDKETFESLSDILMEDTDALKELTHAFKDDFQDAADDAAEGVLRFDNAIVEATDNYDDWIKALNSNTLGDQAEVLKDISNLYGDILDIDPSVLSTGFVKDVSNLELARDALNNVSGAYEELQQRAGRDIIINLDVNEMAFYTKLGQIKAEMAAAQAQGDLEFTAYLHSDGFLSALNELVAMTGASAAQAEALLADYLSLDVTCTEHTNDTEEVQEVKGFDAVLTPTAPQELSLPVLSDDGKSVSQETGYYQAASLTYVPGPPVQVASKKQNKAFTTTVDTVNGTKVGGDFKYSQASHGGGSKGPANVGGGGGGGRKGGSKGKSYTPDKMEIKKDKSDRYHDINQKLEKTTHNYDKLAKAEQKLFGKDLIDNLNKQLKNLEKQNKLLERKLKLEQKEQQQLQKQLSKYGVKFDDEGYMKNYNKIYDKYAKELVDMQKRYNKLTTEEEQKAYKEKIETKQKEFDKLKELMERYDEIFGEIFDIEDQIQDNLDTQIEIQIEKFKMEVEIRLDMSEAEREYNEFKRKVIDGIKDDDILGNARSKLADFESYYNTAGTGIGSIQALTKQVNNTMAQISAGGGIYGDNKKQAMEDLKEYYEELMHQLEDLEDLADEIRESYLDMIDEAIDGFDRQVSHYEFISDLLEHDTELIGLMYGDDAYAEMDRYYKQIESNNNQEIDFLRRRADYAKQMMMAETNPEARKKWEDEWQDSLNELNNKVEDAMENIIDKYVNAIDMVFDELEKKVTNGFGLDYLNEEWDLMGQNADQFLDAINRMSAIRDLEKKYQDAIDAADSVAEQQRLNDLMNEQLGMLREKDKLSQYDVDRANKVLELSLKQMALENAQQNKNKLRLRRDSQGNYSYQFVSDEEEMAQAQQELADAQNDLYNFDKEAYRQNLDDMLSIYEEFQDKMKELYEDQTISAEEREKREALLVEQYQDLINGIVSENESIRNNLRQSAFDSLADLYDTDVLKFKEMSEAEQNELMSQLIPQWESGVQHMADVFAGDDGFIPTCQVALEKLNQTTLDYQNSLDSLEATAGVNFDTIAQGYDQNIQLAQQLLEGNQQLIDSYDQQLRAIQQVILQLDQLIAKYSAAKQEAIAAANAAYSFWQQEEANAAQAAADDAAKSTKTEEKKETKKKKKTETKETKEPKKEEPQKKKTDGGDGKLQVGDTVTYTGGWYYETEYGGGNKGNRGPGKKVKVTIINSGAPYPIHVYSTDSAYGWLKKDQLTGYDTGGYTGDWGKDGKLAMLHEKELVLNKTDTANILSAVSLIRDTGSLISTLNQTMQGRVIGMLGGMGGYSFGKDDQALEQNVHITAEFPGVRDSKEIEEALSNLVNVASQHAFNNQR